MCEKFALFFFVGEAKEFFILLRFNIEIVFLIFPLSFQIFELHFSIQIVLNRKQKFN